MAQTTVELTENDHHSDGQWLPQSTRCHRRRSALSPLQRNAGGRTTFGAFLPAPEGFVPGLGYDLVITSGSINVTTLTLPGAIAFTVRPAITSVTSQFCPKDWVDTTNNRLYCSGGDVLTIIGSFFSPSASLSVQLIAASNSRLGLTVPCPNVNLVSVSTLTCTLPTITNSTVLSAFQSYVSQVQVYENATS